MDIIKKLPKVDLHYHLDGSVTPETLIDIATKENINLPSYNIQELKKHIQVSDNCKSLNEYLSKFKLSERCMQTAYSLRKTAYNAIADVSKHNVKYIEVRFAPLLHTKKGLSIMDVVSNVIKGLEHGEQKYGVVARALLICLRDQKKEKNFEVIKVASHFLNKGVVGVDLAGNEAGFPPLTSKEVFNLAERMGIPITIHAGEAAGSQNIYDSIVHLGARRIGHGVTLNQNKAHVDLIKDRGITLEMCPTSNIQTKAVRTWMEHPIRNYYNQGIPVTVNTDNTAVSNTDITKEYEQLVNYYDFTLQELEQITYNAIAGAFIGDNEKRRIKQEIQKEYRKYVY